jgi:hypothetical protein
MSERSMVAVVALLLGGCVSATFTRTGDQQFPAKATPCDFAVYTTTSPPDLVEVGVVELRSGWDGHGAMNLASARELSAPYVCAAGGDGIRIWGTDAAGRIPKVTVLKKVAAAAPAPSAPAATPAPGG